MFINDEINVFTLDKKNAAVEVEYILNLPKRELNGNMIVFQDDELTAEPIFESFEISMQCQNCERLFELDNYLEHICEYDETQTLIKTEPDEQFIDKKFSLQILNENNQRIQSAFKNVRNNYETWTETKNGKTKEHYKCNICSRQYVHLAGLQRHMESHENESKVGCRDMVKTEQRAEPVIVACKCLSCGRIFRTASEVIEHGDSAHNWAEKYMHRENAMKDAEIANGDSMDRGKIEECLQDELVDVVILDAVLQCEFCDYLFADATFLLIHATSHEPTKGFKCNYCDIHSRCLKQMTNHWTAECPFQLYETKKHVNVTKLFMCNACENKFKTLDDLYWHRYSAYHFFPRLNIDEGFLQVACEKCEEIVDSAEDLIQHFVRKHSKKVRRDPVFDTTSRPYLCDICGKGYTQSSHLYQHLRFHQGIKPFACSEPKCTRRFTIRPDLNDHIRKCHTGERPYKCLECGKSFLTGSVFYQHRLIHRGERRYACQSCDKRFHRSDALKNHERIHTGDKPFVCEICTKSFRQKGDRDKHCKSRHKKILNLKEMGQMSTIYEETQNSLKEIIQMRPVTNNVNGIDVITMSK